jgi:hypothetical protein
VIKHSMHVQYKLAQKRGIEFPQNDDSTRLFLNVWKRKSVSLGKQLVKLKLSFINPFAFKKILFVFVTHNQYLALSPIFDRLKTEATAVRHEFNVSPNVPDATNLPYLYLYLWDWLTFPFFYLKYRKFLFRTYGSYIESGDLLSNSSFTIASYEVFEFVFSLAKPRYLFMANDHLNINVALLHAAKRSDIKTLYFQHANVSEVFPPMTFDYAFLYSESSAQVYTAIQPSKTQLLCVGNMKADQYLDINKERIFDRKNLRIVLCVNSVIELELYQELALKLASLTNVGLIKFRLHPYLRMVKIEFNHSKIIISNAREENSFECFKNMDLLVAGNSSIIEEALFTDTPALYLDLDANMSDYYGYVRDGIVIHTSLNVNGIFKFIESYVTPVSVLNRALQFSSSFNTSYSGRTCQLVEDVFREIDSSAIHISKYLKLYSNYLYSTFYDRRNIE